MAPQAHKSGSEPCEHLGMPGAAGPGGRRRSAPRLLVAACGLAVAGLLLLLTASHWPDLQHWPRLFPDERPAPARRRHVDDVDHGCVRLPPARCLSHAEGACMSGHQKGFTTAGPPSSQIPLLPWLCLDCTRALSSPSGIACPGCM